MSNFEIRNRFEQVKDTIDDGWVESDTSVPSTPPNSLADVTGEYMKKSVYVGESSDSSCTSETSETSETSDKTEISDLSDSKEMDDNQSQEVQHDNVINEQQEESEFTSDDYDEEEDENRVRLENSEEESEESDDPPVEYVIAEQEFRKAYENEVPSLILITATLFLMLLLIRSICQLCLTMVSDGYCICKRA